MKLQGIILHWRGQTTVPQGWVCGPSIRDQLLRGSPSSAPASNRLLVRTPGCCGSRLRLPAIHAEHLHWVLSCQLCPNLAQPGLAGIQEVTQKMGGCPLCLCTRIKINFHFNCVNKVNSTNTRKKTRLCSMSQKPMRNRTLIFSRFPANNAYGKYNHQEKKNGL